MALYRGGVYGSSWKGIELKYEPIRYLKIDLAKIGKKVPTILGGLMSFQGGRGDSERIG